MNHRTIGTVVFAQSTPKIQIFRARPARHAHAAPHEQFSSQSPPHAHVAQSHIGVGGVVVFVVFVVFVSLVFASRVVCSRPRARRFTGRRAVPRLSPFSPFRVAAPETRRARPRAPGGDASARDDDDGDGDGETRDDDEARRARARRDDARAMDDDASRTVRRDASAGDGERDG